MSGILGGYLDSGDIYFTRSAGLNKYIEVQNLKLKYSTKMEETKKPRTGAGVPDGDGGSLEREDKKDNLVREENDVNEGMAESSDQDIKHLGNENETDDADPDNLTLPERENSLGSDSDNRRDNESIEGALNNPGVKISSGGNFSMLKYFNIEFYDSEDGNRTIGCTASIGEESGYYFKGE
jgi:hypothetical protein